jgi:putative ABC transport system permease protein
MFTYYLGLALRSLRRNVVLTALMIAVIGVGIGASMTTLTIFRAMASDPIPGKSRQLFAPQIDNWGPDGVELDANSDKLKEDLSYTDAVALMNAHAARRQAAMYFTGMAVTPSNPQLEPFQVTARATYRDFFAMFDVPFRYGSPWNATDDAARGNVVVITRELNDKVFGGANSVGKTLTLNNQEYRVVGVLDHWEPIPRFYDLSSNKYGKTEELFLPFTRAIDAHMISWGNTNCKDQVAPGWEGLLRSECVWLQFWVELPTGADVQRYRGLLDNYAAEQRRSGRFHWPPHTQLRDVRQWLAYRHAVSDEASILVLVSLSFLIVCLLNSMGLMLAKIMGRAGDIGVRRALGAARRAIFSQCLIETGVVGLAGGLVGLALAALGLWALRGLLSKDMLELTHLDWMDVGISIALAVAATVIAGLYPTWRAIQVQPAWQLKAQ